MKKTLLGLSLIGAIYTMIYGVGVFRQYLEYKYYDGYSYQVFMLPFFRERFKSKIDYSVFGVFSDGLATLFIALIAFNVVLVFLILAHHIGNSLLAKNNKNTKT